MPMIQMAPMMMAPLMMRRTAWFLFFLIFYSCSWIYTTDTAAAKARQIRIDEDGFHFPKDNEQERCIAVC